MVNTARTRTGRGRLLRRALLALSALAAVALVAGALLLPAVASWVAPGVITGAFNGAVRGRLAIDAASISWSGPSRLAGVKLYDPEGNLVAELASVESPLGILDALSLGDLGTTKAVGGTVSLAFATDKAGVRRSNIERALEPKTPAPAAAPAGPFKLPLGMAGALEVSGVDVTAEVPSSGGGAASVVRLPGVSLSAGVDLRVPGGTLTLDLNAPVVAGGDGPAAAAGGRAIRVRATASGLASADGALNLAGLSVDATATASAAPVALLDAALDQRSRLLGTLGDQADATLTAKGTAADAEARWEITSPGGSARGAVAIKDGVLSATAPLTAEVASARALLEDPAVAEQLARAGVTITSHAGLSVRVESLTSVRVPGVAGGGGGGALDLRGAGFELVAAIGGVEGTARLPAAGDAAGADDAGGGGSASGGSGDDRTQPLRIAPIEVRMRSADLASGVRVSVATSPAGAGEPGGMTAEGELEISGVLDAAGAPRAGVPESVSGSVRVGNVPGPLVEAAARSAGIPVRSERDIGPTLDLTLDARAGALRGATETGALPTDLVAQVRSERLSAVVPVRITAAAIESTEPIRVRAAAGGIIGELLAQLTGGAAGRAGDGAGAGASPEGNPGRLRVSGRGQVEGTLEGRVPLGQGAPVIDQAALRAQIQVSDLTVDGAVRGGPVRLSQGSASVHMRPDLPALVGVSWELEHGGEGFGVEGEVRVAGLGAGLPGGTLGTRGRLPVLGGYRGEGRVRVSGVPAGLIEAALASAGVTLPDDQSALARALLGPGTDVTVSLSPRVQGTEQNIGVQVQTADASAGVSVNVALAEVVVAGVNLSAAVDPELWDRLRGPLAGMGVELVGQGGQGVRLAGPTRLTAELGEAVVLPLRPNGAIDVPKIGDGVAQIKLTASDPVLVSGLGGAGAGQTAGLGRLKAEAGVPVSGLVDASRAGQLEAVLAAEGVLLRDGAEVGTVALRDVRARLDGSRVNGRVEMINLSTAAADEVAGRPGLISGALGPAASLGVNLSVDGGAVAVTAEVESSALRLDPVRLAVEDVTSPGGVRARRARIASPLRGTWRIDPALASALLGGAEGGGAKMTLGAPVTAQLEIGTLAIALPEAGGDNGGSEGGIGPMLPGVFALEGQVRIERVALDQADASGVVVRTELEGVRVSVVPGDGGELRLDAAVAQMREGGERYAEPVRLSGQVKGLADARGRVSLSGAEVRLSTEAGPLPTLLADRVAGTGDQLTQVMGAQVYADLTAEVSRLRDGSASLAVRSGEEVLVPALGAQGSRRLPRMTIGGQGPIQSGALDFGRGRALEVVLTDFEVSRQFTLLRLFPLFAAVNKARDGQLATVRSQDLRVPIDGDMSKLEGDVAVDVGTLRYEFGEVFGSLLDRGVLTDQGQQRPVPPFVVRVRRGVARYQNVQLPVRNFTFRTSGTVDLVNSTVDVVTYVPTVAASAGLMQKLNDDVGRGFGRVLPRVLSEGTAVPIRTRGPMNNPEVFVDVELFFKEFGGSLMQAPANIIEGIGNILGGNRGDPPPPPAPGEAPKEDPRPLPFPFPLPLPLPKR